MADDLEQLEDWVGALLRKLEPGERRKLARKIGVSLQRSQSRRIADQRNPDGSAFAPRKRRGEAPLRAKAGRIKRRAQAAKAKGAGMFARLRKPQFLTVEASADEASVGFAGNATGRIARVHQFGLRDRVSKKPGSPTVTYPARVLLGMTDDDRARFLDQVLAHLNA